MDNTISQRIQNVEDIGKFPCYEYCVEPLVDLVHEQIYQKLNRQNLKDPMFPEILDPKHGLVVVVVQLIIDSKMGQTTTWNIQPFQSSEEIEDFHEIEDWFSQKHEILIHMENGDKNFVERISKTIKENLIDGKDDKGNTSKIVFVLEVWHDQMQTTYKNVFLRNLKKHEVEVEYKPEIKILRRSLRFEEQRSKKQKLTRSEKQKLT